MIERTAMELLNQGGVWADSLSELIHFHSDFIRQLVRILLSIGFSIHTDDIFGARWPERMKYII